MQGDTNSDDRLWAMLAHLLGIVAPILAPLIIYFVKKDQSPFVGFHALQSTFVDLAQVVLVTVAGIIAMLTCGVGFVLFPVIMLAWLVFKILPGIKANSGEWYSVPLLGDMARKQVPM